MSFSFDPQLAIKYGVSEAIMIEHFRYWIKHNRANKINQKLGSTWTYKTVEAFRDTYEFWSTGQIRRILNSLITQGVLKAQRLGKFWTDRTLWYAFVDEKQFLDLQGAKSDDPFVPITTQEADAITEKLDPNYQPIKPLPDEIAPIKVAAIYNEAFTPRGLTVDPGQALFQANLQVLSNKQKLTLQDFKRVFTQAKTEFLPHPTKRGMLKPNVLFNPKIFFSVLETANINPGSTSVKPTFFQAATKPFCLSPEQKKLNQDRLLVLKKPAEGTG